MKAAYFAIIKKDMIAAIRNNKLQAVMSLLFPIFVQYVLLQRYTLMSTSKHISGGMPLTYGAFVLILFVSNGLLIKSLVQERISGSLSVTLATGITPGSLWAMKTIAAFVFGYFVTMVVLELEVLGLAWIFQVILDWTLADVLSVMVIGPMVALTLVVIQSTIYWLFRSTLMVAALLPMFVAAGLMYYASVHATANLAVSAALAIVCMTVLLTAICWIIINKVGRSRIV